MAKTTFKEKLGYGIASIGDAIGYGFVAAFFLFFLTTVAGIAPAIAGTIVAIGAVWNAVFNPVMGYFADSVATRFGKRRPLIFLFSIFLSIVLILMFTNVDLPSSVKSIYYGMMMILFWSCYTGFFVPYFALGTDYASDYDERTSIRSFAAFFNIVGNIFCMVMPTIIVEFLEKHGLTTEQAWFTTACFLGALTLITILVTFIVSKTKDLPCEKVKRPPNKNHVIINIFKEYASVAKLRPMKYLIAASLCSLVTYTILMSNLLYYLTFNLRLSALQISACLLLRSVFGIILLPLAGKLSAIFDKRIAMIINFTFGILGMIVIKIIAPSGFLGAMIYMFFFTISTSVYWQLMPSIFYDICEYDKHTTGKKRDAMILSFQGLVESVAAGLGGQILGMILQLAGFDGSATVQTGTAMLWIENSATLIPTLFMLPSCLALYKYPLRRNDLYPQNTDK